jgi:Zn-dependent membrane protease YugP
MPFLFYDPTMILLIPALILSFWAQMAVSNAFKKYSKIRTLRGITGAKAAQTVLSTANTKGSYLGGIQ